MPGKTASLPAADRVRAILLTITIVAGLAILAVLAPASAHASGCSDSWTNTAGGSWFTGANWSKGAPPKSEEEACIVAPGTYTVTMYQSASTVSLQSLTIGGETGTQTLSVGSTCSLNAVLSTTAGIFTTPQGAITLTNGDGCGDGVTLAGPIDNSGTITSEPASGGARKLEGSIANKGTLAFNANTSYAGASSLLTNEGTLDVAEAKQLSASGGASLTNGTGGKIAGTGSGDILITGGTLTEGAGTTTGTQPLVVDDGSVAYNAGGGASLIALRGTSSLSGTSASGQTLALQSTCGENATITAAAGFTNGGTLYLTNGDGCGDSVTLNVSGAGLSNSGTILSEPAHGGSRQITGSLTNTGTLAIDASTSYGGTGALLSNEGALDVAEGRTLTVAAKSAFTNGTGGSIVATGNGDVLATAGSTFTEGAGTTSGSEPVIADDATLIYTGAGAGAGKISLRGSSALSGNVAVNQTLAIQSTCSENALVTATASFTNAGSIALTNGDGCGNSATLATTAGTLTNSGKLTTEVDHGGARTLEGNLTNTGTLAIGANTAYDSKGAALANEGALEVAETKQLTVSNGGSLTNAAGGSITVGAGADVLLGPGTTFNEGAGTTAGGKPVIVDDGTLNYTGGGASQVIARGSSALSGNLAAEQSLSIQSTCSENAVVTAATSFTNAGSITLTNGDGCGNSATLATTAGSLTNSGKLFTQPANGGARTLDGNLTNTGTITINTNTSYPTAGATLDNEGTISVLSGVTLTIPSSAAATVTNGPKGLIEGIGSGALVQTGGKFNWGLGDSTGHEPVILDDLTLDFTEHGAGRVALRGASTLVGTIRSGETLVLESTCSEHSVATTSAVGVTNNGTLELTNGDGCSDNVTLNTKGGTLTSSGTIDVDYPAGGLRTIEGNVLSSGILTLAARATLHVGGTYTQTSTARLKPYIASASEYGSLSATGAVTLGGLLVVHQVLPFKATLGQTYPIVSGASLSGSFASESEDQVYYTGIYYKPTYSASSATLVVSQATQVRSPHSGAPGSVIAISGSGYLPNDTITVTFSDHAGAKTVFPAVTTNSSGEFSTEITVPAKAAPGTATTLVTSALTGVHISLGFSVT